MRRFVPCLIVSMLLAWFPAAAQNAVPEIAFDSAANDDDDDDDDRKY